jgi:hypothetical protein
MKMLNFRGYVAAKGTDWRMWLVMQWVRKAMLKRSDWDILEEMGNLLNRKSVFCQIPDGEYEGITIEPTYSVKERF